MTNEWPIVQESDEEYVYQLLKNEIELNSAKYGVSYIQSFWESKASQGNTKIDNLQKALSFFKQADFNPVIYRIMQQISNISCITSLSTGGSVSPSYVYAQINNVIITESVKLSELISISLGTLEIIWKVCKLDVFDKGFDINDPESTLIPKVLKRLSIPVDTPLENLPVAVKIFLKSKSEHQFNFNFKLINPLQHAEAVLNGHKLQLPKSEDDCYESLNNHILRWKTHVDPIKAVIPFMEWSSMVAQATNGKIKGELMQEVNFYAYQDLAPDYTDLDLIPNISKLVNYENKSRTYNPNASLSAIFESDIEKNGE